MCTCTLSVGTNVSGTEGMKSVFINMCYTDQDIHTQTHTHTHTHTHTLTHTHNVNTHTTQNR